eukprot:6174177-Pleurochrysis_carterae.AAC.1
MTKHRRDRAMLCKPSVKIDNNANLMYLMYLMYLMRCCLGKAEGCAPASLCTGASSGRTNFLSARVSAGVCCNVPTRAMLACEDGPHRAEEQANASLGLAAVVARKPSQAAHSESFGAQSLGDSAQLKPNRQQHACVPHKPKAVWGSFSERAP